MPGPAGKKFAKVADQSVWQKLFVMEPNTYGGHAWRSL
jgi:hypothetical protein